ncbi:MAG: outer membrane protein assembly factor BamA [Pseudomonadota bacterium]
MAADGVRASRPPELGATCLGCDMAFDFWRGLRAVRFARLVTAGAPALLAAAAAFALAGAPSPSAAQDAGAAAAPAGQKISRIVIRGAKRIEPGTVRSYLRIAEGDVVSAPQVNAALKRLFATGLFKDVTVTPRRDGILLVVVSENPIINEITFEGNTSLSDEILLAQIRSRPRAAFTRARADGDAQTILGGYRAAGRFSATVEPKIIQRPNNRVDLVFEITEGDEVGVSAINFIGNVEFSDSKLRGEIETSESAFYKFLSSTDNYDPDRLEFDKELLRRFYFSRGYADFEVLSAVAELNTERDGFFITFTVSEGERYDTGEVTLISDAMGVDAAQFQDLVRIDQGETYNADKVQETVSQIQERAGKTDVNFINIRPEAQKRRGAENEPVIDVTFRVVEAPRVYVERIEIEGNSRTLERVIRRQFEFVEGDAFNAFRLQRSRAKVRQLGFFSSVDVETERGSSDDRVIVRTKVQEQSTGDISFGLGFSTTESVGGQISLTERNFLGRGQFVRASASLTSDRQFFEFRFTEPYFLGRDLRAGFDSFHTITDNQDESSFDTRRTGFRPRIGFPINDFSSVSFNYLIQGDDIRDVPFDASPLVSLDAGDRIVSSAGYNYVVDLRDDPNEPKSGFIFNLSQDFAGLGGDARSVRSETSVKGFTAFFDDNLVTSLELAGGAIVGFDGDEDIRVNDRFRLGGDSFFGFSSSGIGPRDTNQISLDGGATPTNINDSLGGEYFAVARFNASFPLGLPEEFGIAGGVFANVGTLWGLDETEYTAVAPGGAVQTFTVDDSLRLRASAGVSLFWESPFGPLRLNLASPVLTQSGDNVEVFSFSAGTRF